MNSAEGNIADFFAEVVVMFDAEAQFTKLQDQLRNFSARIGAITIPVRLTGVNDASLEMSAMGDFGTPAGRSRSGGLTENQWEGQTTRSMFAQGYKMGEGGWYKPAGAEAAGAKTGEAAGAGRGLGMLSGIGGALGFAGSMAGFMAVFATVGDLVKGAHYDQQLAVLRQLIPNQQQYAQALSTINEVANTAGTNIMDTAHSFTKFTNASQVAGVSFDQSVQSFKALTYAIAGTGSQSQASRIFGDFSHMILNSSQISMARIQRSDLGTYLAIPALLEGLPQFEKFKGDSEGLTKAFNDLTKSQQLTLINTVLLSRYQSLAAASADTVSGRFVVLENELASLGATLVSAASPMLKQFIDVINITVSGINLLTLYLEKFEAALPGFNGNNPIQSLGEDGKAPLGSAPAETLVSMASSLLTSKVNWDAPSLKSAFQKFNNTISLELHITDKTNKGVTPTVKPAKNINPSVTLRRTF